jgi:hypothetical protein
VTLYTEHSSLNVLLVIEFDPFNLKVTFWLNMARPTLGAGKTVLLSLKTRFIEMADKAICFCDGKVCALDNLGMAARASKLLPSPQLLEMFIMIECHILKNHLSSEIHFLMASLLETSAIANLCMGLGWPLPCDKHHQRDLTIPPLPLEMVDKARFVVTLGAIYEIVRRSLPGVHVDLHVVAEPTKGRGLRKLVADEYKNNEYNETKGEKSQKAFSVFFRASVCFPPEG